MNSHRVYMPIDGLYATSFMTFKSLCHGSHIDAPNKGSYYWSSHRKDRVKLQAYWYPKGGHGPRHSLHRLWKQGMRLYIILYCVLTPLNRVCCEESCGQNHNLYIYLTYKGVDRFWNGSDQKLFLESEPSILKTGNSHIK